MRTNRSATPFACRAARVPRNREGFSPTAFRTADEVHGESGSRAAIRETTSEYDTYLGNRPAAQWIKEQDKHPTCRIERSRLETEEAASRRPPRAFLFVFVLLAGERSEPFG